MADENRAAKMQLFPLVGNAFLQSLEQPISKTWPGLGFSMFFKKGCKELEFFIEILLKLNSTLKILLVII